MFIEIRHQRTILKLRQERHIGGNMPLLTELGLFVGARVSIDMALLAELGIADCAAV